MFVLRGGRVTSPFDVCVFVVCAVCDERAGRGVVYGGGRGVTGGFITEARARDARSGTDVRPWSGAVLCRVMTVFLREKNIRSRNGYSEGSGVHITLACIIRR